MLKGNTSFQHWSSHWQVFLQGPYSVPPSRLAYQLDFAPSQGFLVSGHRSREGLVRCGNIWEEGKEREARPVNAVHTIRPQATHLSLVTEIQFLPSVKFSFIILSLDCGKKPEYPEKPAATGLENV